MLKNKKKMFWRKYFMRWRCRGLLAGGEPGTGSVFAGALLKALDRSEGGHFPKLLTHVPDK